MIVPPIEIAPIPPTAFIPYTPEDRLKVIDAIGNNTLRMAGLLGVAALSQEDHISTSELNHFLCAYNEPRTPAVNHIHNRFFARTLQPQELATVENISGVNKAKISAKGNSIGLAIAGGLINTMLDAPQSNFLATALGPAGRNTGQNPRRMIYARLLEGPASKTELQTVSSIAKNSLDLLLQDLSALGVLCNLNSEQASVHDHAANSMYRLPECPRRPAGQLSETLQAGLRAAELLCFRGISQTSGSAILTLASRVNPRLPAERIWMAFAQYVHSQSPGADSIKDLRPIPQDKAARIAITASFLPHLERLMQTIDRLSGTEPEDINFQMTGREEAIGILGSRSIMNQLLNHDSNQSSKSDQWLPLLGDLIPEAGITSRELHDRVVKNIGKPISYGTFLRQLRSASIPGYVMHITRGSGLTVGPNSKSCNIVSLHRQVT